MTRRTPIGTLVVSLSIVLVFLVASFAYYYTTTENQATTLNAQVSALNGQVSTLKGQLSSLNGSNAQLQSQIAKVQCIRTGQGYAFYVRVATDVTNESVSGAKVDAIPYTVCASGYTDFGNLVTTMTPSNGTVSLNPSGIDGYIVIVNYHGSNYTSGEVFAAPVMVTNVIFHIPSGNVTIRHGFPYQS